MRLVFDLLRRLRKLVSEEGLAFAARQVVRYCRRYLNSLLPATRQTLRDRANRERAFDEEHGIRTTSIRMPRRNDVVGHRWLGGHKYEAVDHEFDFELALAACDIRFEEHVFVDIGAGMGRALVLAARLPFKRLIGVEYSAELTAAARENIRSAASPSNQCGDITIVHADAVEYDLPIEPLVLFLYNPFACNVMAEFVANVHRSFSANPRRVVVVYLNPRCGDVWRTAGFVRHIGDSNGASIFDTHPQARPPLRAGFPTRDVMPLESPAM